MCLFIFIFSKASILSRILVSFIYFQLKFLKESLLRRNVCLKEFDLLASEKMDLIKGYLDQSDDDLQDDQMVIENEQAIGSTQSGPGDSGTDRLMVNDQIEEPTIDQGRTEAKSDKQSERDEPVKPKTSTRRRRNADEIVISSDESSSDESSSDESSFEHLSAEENELNSDPEEVDLPNDLDKCLTRMAPMKTKGELLIEELPPPEEETIQLTCDVDQLQQVGSVAKILENLVIVESFKDLPALDLDSVLFFRTGKSIGRVFDVIGSVSKPFYVIRFVSAKKIEENAIFVNMPAYFVPPDLCLASFQELNVTKYVLVSQLKVSKGTDASWLHNNEPPENVKDYSDDEEERKEQRKLKAKRKPANNANASRHENVLVQFSSRKE